MNIITAIAIVITVCAALVLFGGFVLQLPLVVCCGVVGLSCMAAGILEFICQ